MKMSTALKTAIGSALANVINEYSYVFLSSDAYPLDTVDNATRGGATPAAAGLTSFTGANGARLDALDVGAPVVGTTAVTVTCSLRTPLVASADGYASYLVLCSESTTTSGSVGATFIIDQLVDPSIPVSMSNQNVWIGDKIRLPSLTFSIPVS